jgi:hypothetical protein
LHLKFKEFDPKDFDMTPEESKSFNIQQVYVFQLDMKAHYNIVLEEISNEETYS